MDNIVFSNQEIKLFMQFSESINKAVKDYLKEYDFFNLSDIFINVKEQKKFIKDVALLIGRNDFDSEEIKEMIIDSQMYKMSTNFNALNVLAELIQEEFNTNEELKEMWELNFAY